MFTIDGFDTNFKTITPVNERQPDLLHSTFTFGAARLCRTTSSCGQIRQGAGRVLAIGLLDMGAEPIAQKSQELNVYRQLPALEPSYMLFHLPYKFAVLKAVLSQLGIARRGQH